MNLEWNAIWIQSEEQELDRIKKIVNPSDYKKVQVAPERAFYVGKTMSRKEKEDYVKLLKEYSDVFAWTPSDLQEIPLDLGEHHIDLMDGAV